MIRLFVALSSLAALATSLAPTAHAQRVAGEWTGRYICGQGVTALRLTVDAGPAGKTITAIFRFGPLPENPGVPRGVYTMRGTYDASSRHLRLTGEAWVEAPPGYVMVPLDGYLSASGQKISGHVPGAYPCTDFEVWRPSELVG